MKVYQEVQELRLGEIHHYVNTAQGKIERVVTVSDSESQLHGPYNSNSTYCKAALGHCSSSGGIIWSGPKNGPGEAAARSLSLPVPQLKFLHDVG